MTRIDGSCHCGAVRYSIDAEPLSVVNCHCNLCRNHSGGAFASYVIVHEADLALEGEDSLARYAVTERATKHFCAKCGTPVFNTTAIAPGIAAVYLGTMRSDAGLTPKTNIFCESKLAWIDAVSSITSFPQFPVRG